MDLDEIMKDRECYYNNGVINWQPVVGVNDDEWLFQFIYLGVRLGLQDRSRLELHKYMMAEAVRMIE